MGQKDDLRNMLLAFTQESSLEFRARYIVEAVPELCSEEAIKLLEEIAESRGIRNELQDHIDFLKWSNQDNPTIASMKMTGRLNERLDGLDPANLLEEMRRRSKSADLSKFLE